MTNFKQFNLSSQILSALEKKGYTSPTPIQIQAIPHLLKGKDLLGIAQTGTGKTAAFALPILDNLFKNAKSSQHSNIRALILTPTRELATQINDNIKIYGKDLHLKSVVVFGGVSIVNQIRAVKNGFDILVATPGRLLDLMNQGIIKFPQLEIFVLDEADRMLDMGFINDVQKIIAKIPKQRQTLFFSATMPKDVAILANSILNNPIRIEVTPESTTVEKIDQKIHLVDKANKPLLLKFIIENEAANSLFLVFSKTKHNANRIAEFLEKQKIKSAAIHGNKSQGARERALEGFRLGKIKVLVATDIAARGIDIAGITHVINYELPNHPESYVHRIGRTARAGREGVAISFCDNSESSLLWDIEKIIKIKLPIDKTHPFHGVKATASERSLLPAKDRPKSGYKNSVQTTQKPKNSSSYFSETKKWQSSREDTGGDSKSRFGNRAGKPARYDFKEKSAANFDDNSPRPKFDNQRKSFGAKRREEANDRDRPSFRGSSFKKNFGGQFDKRAPRNEDSRSSSKFDNGDSNSERPKFDDNERNSRNYSKSKYGFGDKKFGNRSSFGNNESRYKSSTEKDFDDRKSSSYFGEFSDKNRKPKFDSRFKENKDRQKNEGGSDGKKRFSNYEEKAFASNRSGNSNKKFGSGFRAKLGEFSKKLGNFGSKKPKKPK